MSSTVPFTHRARKLFPSAAVRRWDLENDAGIIARIKAIAGVSDPLAPFFESHAIPGEVTTLPRSLANQNGLGTLSGNARFTYFTSPKTGAFTKLRSICGGTAAVAPTLAKMALYSVNGSTGVLTQIAITPNDTTLWTAASTAYEKATSASYSLTKGDRYAFATLVTGATTYPTLAGMTGAMSQEAARQPKLGGLITGQTDLLASYNESQFNGNFPGTYFGVCVP